MEKTSNTLFNIEKSSFKMSGPSSNSYIGRIVSLISTANIRYEGTIYMIDNDKITLKNGSIFEK